MSMLVFNKEKFKSDSFVYVANESLKIIYYADDAKLKALGGDNL